MRHRHETCVRLEAVFASGVTGARLSTKLSVEHVYKVFGAHPKRALERIERGEGKDTIFAETGMTVGVSDASFEVQEGEIFVVMGLSGSGKSTLVRMLNRLIEPTAGAIRIDGRDITRMTRRELIELRRREISMVFQSFALMPHQTVLENTAFGLNVAGTSSSEREKRALDALAGAGRVSVRRGDKVAVMVENNTSKTGASRVLAGLVVLGGALVLGACTASTPSTPIQTAPDRPVVGAPPPPATLPVELADRGYTPGFLEGEPDIVRVALLLPFSASSTAALE